MRIFLLVAYSLEEGNCYSLGALESTEFERINEPHARRPPRRTLKPQPSTLNLNPKP